MLLSNQPVVDKANQFSTKKEIIFILFFSETSNLELTA